MDHRIIQALAVYFGFSLLGPPWLRAGLGVLVRVGAIGAIDRSLPFSVLKAKSHINERATDTSRPSTRRSNRWPGGSSAPPWVISMPSALVTAWPGSEADGEGVMQGHAVVSFRLRR